MKKITKIGILAFLFLVPTKALAADPATVNLYVSPLGSDSNDCSSALTACQSPNAAIEKIAPDVTAPVVVNFDVGNFYSPPYGVDGGASTAADSKGLIDVEGFNISRHGSLTFLGSTQQINPAGLVVGAVDAGTLTAGGSKYAGWVQIAIDGGMGGYANDAGLCYFDGGVCVLTTNALAGDYIQFTVGAGLITAPIVSNTTGAGAITINYVVHSGTQGNNVTAPTAASKFNLFSLKSFLYPYPSDGGPSTSYTGSAVYLANVAATSAPNMIANPINGGSIPTNANVSFQYLNFPAAPEGTGNIDFTEVDNYSTALTNFVNDNFSVVGDGVATNWPGSTLAVSASNVVLSANATGVSSWGGQVFVTGDYFSGPQAGYTVKATNTTVDAECDQISYTASINSAFPLIHSSLTTQGLFIDQGSSTVAAISAEHNSTLNLFSMSSFVDGGPGAIICGSSGAIGNMGGVQLADGGSNEISTDNGVTWITQTTRKAQDGGSAGVNAFCNVGSGCCYTSY